jgi:hypothetical protein
LNDCLFHNVKTTQSIEQLLIALVDDSLKRLLEEATVVQGLSIDLCLQCIASSVSKFLLMLCALIASVIDIPQSA